MYVPPTDRLSFRCFECLILKCRMKNATVSPAEAPPKLTIQTDITTVLIATYSESELKIILNF